MSQLGAHVLGHVVRRAIQVEGNDGLEQAAQAWEKLDYDFPSWGFYVIWATVIFFGLQILKYQYTVGHVVSTLAMIEEPSSTLIIETKATETYSDDEPDATIQKGSLLDVEQTIQTIPNKPITAKIRTTLKHITAQGGWKVRYRGLGIGIFYMGLRVWVVALLVAILPSFGPLGHVLIAGLSSAITAPLHAIWTHSTITKPVKLTLSEYTKKHSSRALWKAVLLPAFSAAVMTEASIQLTICTHDLVFNLLGHARDWRVLVGAVAVLLVSIFTSLFCMLPSLMVLKRVEASLLPEEFETLVPFDRTFGGLLEPAVVGTSTVARMKAARRSVSCAQFKRVISVYVKTYAIVAALAFTAVHVVMLELFLIMGDAGKTLFLSAEAQLRQSMKEWQGR